MDAAPLDIKLRRAEGRLVVTWPGPEETSVSVRQLRQACRCAMCIDERTGAPILDPSSVPEDIGVSNMHGVGNYAVAFTFTDGHDTGIYSWKLLRELTRGAP